MKIIDMHLECFKGVRDATYRFNDSVTSFCGKNGTGKTTLAVAWTWLWTDKDYSLQSNPDVRPDYMEESEPSVAITCEVNRKTVKFRKYQTDMRTKKQKEQDAPVRVSNKYEINDVPKTQKDFFKEVEAMGIDVDNFLLLTHTDILMSMKVADRRSVIFALAGDITDIDVAKSIEECADAAKLLEDYRADEIVSMQKVTSKKAKEKKESIPNQIIGLERAKVDVDPTLPDMIAESEKRLKELKEQLDEARKNSDASNIDARINELRNRKVSMYNDANSERLKNYRNAHDDADTADDALADAKRKQRSIEQSGEGINASFSSANGLYKQLSSELADAQKEKFTARKNCPTCGQPIPKEKIDEAKKAWEKNHQSKIKELEDRMRSIKTQISSYAEEGKALSARLKEAKEAVAEADKVLMQKKAVVDKYSIPVTPDYTDIDKEIESLNESKKQCDTCAKKAYRLVEEIDLEQKRLRSYESKRSIEQNNDRIDDEIRTARDEQRHYAQVQADAEKILYQMQLINQKKNEMLSEQVNSHFSRVKFRLFSVQKNGEIKDDCTPLVLCSDGEYRDMTYGANTAAIVAAKIDICVGLQKFYGQELPIWLDGAECFDGENRKELTTATRQLVLLCVSDDERLVTK